MRILRMTAIGLLVGAIPACGFGDVTDGFAPFITITSPVEAEVANVVSFSANVIDETGVAKVTFLVDGAVLADDLSEPYTTSWDTSLVEDGAHLLQVKAEDLSGNKSSISKSVTVKNIKN
jgi:hypothetical protein